jgi:hypothetical protein
MVELAAPRPQVRRWIALAGMSDNRHPRDD